MVENQEDDIEERDSGATDEEAPWSATMNIGGQSYAVSLFWQPMQDADDPMEEIKETAQTVLEGADLYCLRQGAAPQYALGVSEEGHKVGQSAAAPAVADAFSDQPSFVSVFKVDEGWWFLAVRNDLILSEEDVLYINEEDAQREFFSMMAVPDWGKKIAPAEWGIDGTEELELEPILRNSRQIKLQKIGGLKGIKFILAVAAAGIIGIWILLKILGMLFGFDLFGEKKPVVVPIAPPKIIKKIEKPLVIEKEVKPWEQLPIVTDFTKICWQTTFLIKSIPTPGWEVDGITCTPDGVAVKWKRNTGQVSWMEKSLNNSNVDFISKKFATDGNSVVAGILTGDKIRVGNSTPTMPQENIINEINNIFQASGEEVTLSANGEQSIDNSMGLKKVVQNNNKYPKISFKFNSSYDPVLWGEVLSNFPGLELNRIVYNNGKWAYEGQIYEREKFENK